MARSCISEGNTKYPITHSPHWQSYRWAEETKTLSATEILILTLSMCKDWIQGFHLHKILRKKENAFMSMEFGFRLQFVSVWAKGKWYYSNIFMLWSQACILVSPSSCTHTAGSQLYTCNPTLEVKAGAGLYPSSHSHSTQKLHFCPTGRETNASQTSPAFCYSEASILSLTQNILTCPGSKKFFLQNSEHNNIVQSLTT